MLLSGSDIIIKTLIEQGCDTVFGYPGNQILDVYESLYKYRKNVKHVLTAHEQGAAHAADGYARATGKPGVVIATSGPGATNLVTGIATAHLDSVPMIAITGNVMTSQIGSDAFQEIDITGITLPITKHNYFVNSVEELADTIREAFKLAVSGRPGPVLIDVPKDVQMAKCRYVPQGPVSAEEKFPAKEIRIYQAAKTINDSKRPYIYFGGGVVSSGAQEEMLALAEKIDAPIGCSMMGLSGIPSDHPGFLGMQGIHGHYAASAAMQKADCIIALGVRFNDRVTANNPNFCPDAKIVHIDVDGSELSKTVTAFHGLRADVKLTLQKMLPLIEKSEKQDWKKTIDALRDVQAERLDTRDGMTPRNVILTVNNHLSEDTPVVTDVGQHQLWSAQNLTFKKTRKFISSGGLGTMGFGLGAAIGAYFATGERPVLITGDGSFGMSLNELATAVSYKVPVTIIIMNNGVLGMVRQCQTLYFNKHYSGTTLGRKTKFVKLAKAFGADGAAVSSLEELDSAIIKGANKKGPFIIDCAIDKDEFVYPAAPRMCIDQNTKKEGKKK
jgi:acetolactate synthase-1/2/3 large subunit